MVRAKVSDKIIVLENLIEKVADQRNIEASKLATRPLVGTVNQVKDMLGKFEEAVANHRQALKLNPNYAEAYSKII